MYWFVQGNLKKELDVSIAFIKQACVWIRL